MSLLQLADEFSDLEEDEDSESDSGGEAEYDADGQVGELEIELFVY